ncbi:MAG: hypothetical protein AB7U18_17390, partial [Dehalococcoidia bacterium]
MALFENVDPIGIRPIRLPRNEPTVNIQDAEIIDEPAAPRMLRQSDIEVIDAPPVKPETPPPPPTKSLGQTLRENWRRGVEAAGAGLSAGIGRDASVVASDIADVNRDKRSVEEQEFD